MRAFLTAALAVAFFGLSASLLHAALPSPNYPWEKAKAVIDATEADARTKGFQGIQPHIADLEATLASAAEAYRAAVPASGPIYIFVDGQQETLAALLVTSTGNQKGHGRDARAVENPYIRASFYLGSYYNEIDKPLEAMRVLDAGLALPQPAPDMAVGDHRPPMISERGAALGKMKRWADALADYDMGLKLTGLQDKPRALLLRGRGFALTEMGRLDDAEKSYRDSLAADPNNPTATRELGYIAKLRAGGAPKATQLQAPASQKR
jgi:tetratricopeptide (TPR) repeat protein